MLLGSQRFPANHRTALQIAVWSIEGQMWEKVRMVKDVGPVGAEVPMSDKYLPKAFEGDLPTQPSTKPTAPRIVSLPKGILIPLIVLLACVFSHLCSRASAEQKAVANAKTEPADRTVQEVGIAIASEGEVRKKQVLVLHTLKVKRPWNLLFNRYFREALEQSGLPPYELEIENLDLLEFGDEAYKEILTKQLKHKYGTSAPDIIVITFCRNNRACP